MDNRNCDYQQDFETLMGEVNEMSDDISQYLNFLIKRRPAIQQVLSGSIISNN